MLALGRALMAEPRLLMLDEPSLGLGAADRARDLPHRRRPARDGVSILLVEQNARAALEIADYGYVLETGEIALAGSSAVLASDPRVVATYLGGVDLMARAPYDGVVVAVPVTVPYVRYSTGARTGSSAARSRVGRLRKARRRRSIDGLAVASFTLAPDTAVGVTQHLGLSLALARSHADGRRVRRRVAAARGARGAGAATPSRGLHRRRYQPRRQFSPQHGELQPVRARRDLSLRLGRTELRSSRCSPPITCAPTARRARTSAALRRPAQQRAEEPASRCSRSR